MCKNCRFWQKPRNFKNHKFRKTPTFRIRKNRGFLCETKDQLARKVAPIFLVCCSVGQLPVRQNGSFGSHICTTGTAETERQLEFLKMTGYQAGRLSNFNTLVFLHVATLYENGIKCYCIYIQVETTVSIFTLKHSLTSPTRAI